MSSASARRIRSRRRRRCSSGVRVTQPTVYRHGHDSNLLECRRRGSAARECVRARRVGLSARRCGSARRGSPPAAAPRGRPAPASSSVGGGRIRWARQVGDQASPAARRRAPRPGRRPGGRRELRDWSTASYGLSLGASLDSALGSGHGRPVGVAGAGASVRAAWAARAPKTRHSSNELEARRLAPCAPVQAASPGHVEARHVGAARGVGADAAHAVVRGGRDRQQVAGQVQAPGRAGGRRCWRSGLAHESGRGGAARGRPARRCCRWRAMARATTSRGSSGSTTGCPSASTSRAPSPRSASLSRKAGAPGQAQRGRDGTARTPGRPGSRRRARPGQPCAAVAGRIGRAAPQRRHSRRSPAPPPGRGRCALPLRDAHHPPVFGQQRDHRACWRTRLMRAWCSGAGQQRLVETISPVAPPPACRMRRWPWPASRPRSGPSSGRRARRSRPESAARRGGPRAPARAPRGGRSGPRPRPAYRRRVGRAVVAGRWRRRCRPAPTGSTRPAVGPR